MNLPSEHKTECSLQGAIIAWNFMYNQFNTSYHYNKALSNRYYEELNELTK